MKKVITVTIDLKLTSDEISVDFDPSKYHDYCELTRVENQVIQEMIRYNLNSDGPELGFDDETSYTSKVTGIHIDGSIRMNTEEKKAFKRYSEKNEKEYIQKVKFLDHIAEEHGIEKTIYSMDEKLDEVLASGKVRFIYTSGWGETDFESDTFENPTYLDVWKVADAAVKHSGDLHHIFLERCFSVEERTDGHGRTVKIYDLSFGS